MCSGCLSSKCPATTISPLSHLELEMFTFKFSLAIVSFVVESLIHAAGDWFLIVILRPKTNCSELSRFVTLGDMYSRSPPLLS